MDSSCISPSDATEDLDPRVQEELEKLNSTTDEINKLETQLDDANAAFRARLSESTQKLNLLGKKLGKCISKARPFYEAQEVARNAQLETQKAAIQYQRANSIHMAAKETITLAEERFLSKKQEWEFDNAWQEMLNHATMKVMEAESMKRESEKEHQIRAALFTEAENKVQILERKLKRHIAKSRPYFEMKDVLQNNLEMLKERVQQLQKSVMLAKRRYAESLHNLETISEEIHERRRIGKLKFREPGVGAEIPLNLPDINLGLSYKRSGTGSSTTSELGSETDFDDDNSSHTTEDPETEALHRDLVDLSESMAFAAISVNHYPEAFHQKSLLSPTDYGVPMWQNRTSSCGSGNSSLPESSSELTPDEPPNVSQQRTCDDDAKSFVSVDLND